MGCAGSKDDDSPALRNGASSSSLDTSTRKKAEPAVTTPNLDKLHSDAAAYLKASKGLKLDFAVQKEEASHQIQALSELNDAARAARESEDSSSTRPSTAPAATAAPEEEQEDGFEDISATAQQAPTAAPETEHSFVDEDEDEDGAAARTRTAPDEEKGAARPSGFDPRGGGAATEGYEVIAEALVRAADGFGVAIGRAAVLGAAEHDCGMITALSGPAAASSLRVGDRIVAIDGEEVRSYQAAAAALEAAPGDLLLTVERPTAVEAEGGKEARHGGARRRRKVALGLRAAGQMKKGSSSAGEPASAVASEQDSPQDSPQASPQASPRKGGSCLSSSLVRSKAAAAVAKLEAGSPGRVSSMKALRKLDPLNVSGRLGGQLDRVGDNLDKVNLKRLDPLNVSGKLGGQLDRVSEKLDKVNLKKLDPLNVSGKLGERLDRLDGKLEKMRPSARRAAGPEAPAAAPEPAPPQPLVDPQLELLDMDI